MVYAGNRCSPLAKASDMRAAVLEGESLLVTEAMHASGRRRLRENVDSQEKYITHIIISSKEHSAAINW